MEEPFDRRRLVAILAADVVGYSRLMGADERGTLERLLALRAELIDPTIARHQGRLVKLMGDGALVEFGSAVDAALCASSIQEAIARRNDALPETERLTLRIGLHLGEVLVVGDDIYGDGVNVAARLEQLAAPGGIAASVALIDQIRGRTPLDWQDGGEHQLKNIERPVHVFHLDPVGGKPAPRLAGRAGQGSRRQVWVLASAGLVVVTAAAVAFLVWLREPATSARPPEDRPAIAVLPLQDQSAGADEAWLADGLAEDITSALSRFDELIVVASNAGSAWRDPTADPAMVGRALGARHLVRGSVRRDAERLRVTAELVDAEPRIVRWSERFEIPRRDLFQVQDTIAQSVVTTLAVRLGQLERNRVLAKPSSDLAAYDLVLRGRHLVSQATRSANREARRLLEQAIALDPLYAPAHAALAWAWHQTVTAGWAEFPEEVIARVEQSALRATELDGTLAGAHRMMGLVHLFHRRYDLGVAELDRALAFNRSDAESLAHRGAVLVWTGRAAEAAADLELARRIDPTLALVSMNLAMAYFLLDRPADAILALERGLASERNPGFKISCWPPGLPLRYCSRATTRRQRRGASSWRSHPSSRSRPSSPSSGWSAIVRSFGTR